MFEIPGYISLPNIVEVFAFFMLLMALLISTARTVQQMIPYYRFQCVGLAGITLLTALEPSQAESHWAVALFVIVPLVLIFFIEPLLAQATVPEDIPVIHRLARLLRPIEREKVRRQAVPAWLRSRFIRRRALLMTFDLALILLAFIAVFTLPSDPGVNAGAGNSLGVGLVGLNRVFSSTLAISFALLLLGLSLMIGTADMISQAMGLLVMEQGMFLAAVRLISNLNVAIFFVGGLFLYMSITLTILIFILPDLHQNSGTLNIDEQTRLKG